ncbi:pimeloyl-ACP methyl ester carboxylesterase [Kitasatospora gansuensis]|uniref:Pimeloyl-ACP methyl ester carboxylesterase n=1 Tax=Kitasatospora gansuensis TaxID=258050 RepID=A0A7W7S8A6_9ACTN|nr:alpha/beta fold hydrolase [Kitasatospora gansuensis]MBB4945754.1 pimeloyl-ACP methyl ester carboxylesterase [Kitasatospora gansuensis]
MSTATLPADCVLPAAEQEYRIRSADGHWIHAAAYGPEGAPLVVLAHGWTCSTRFWAPVIHQLLPDHRVVAYDQRGHGRSDIPATPAGYSTVKLADDLEAVLGHVVPAGARAVLAGHSMGGMTIMAAADRAEVADRTAATVLVSTGPGDLLAELNVLPAAVRGGLRRFLGRQLLQSRLPLGPVTPVTRAALKYATMGPATPADRVEANVRIVHACPAGVRYGWSRVLGTLDLYDRLAKLAAPTAVVVGTHDRLTPPVHSHRMLAALPAPEGLLELPGVGHMSPVERPAEVAGEIRRLVDSYLLTTRKVAE